MPQLEVSFESGSIKYSLKEFNSQPNPVKNGTAEIGIVLDDKCSNKFRISLAIYLNKLYTVQSPNKEPNFNKDIRIIHRPKYLSFADQDYSDDSRAVRSANLVELYCKLIDKYTLAQYFIMDDERDDPSVKNLMKDIGMKINSLMSDRPYYNETETDEYFSRAARPW